MAFFPSELYASLSAVSLLNGGADPDQTNPAGLTLLHRVKYPCQSEVVNSGKRRLKNHSALCFHSKHIQLVSFSPRSPNPST